MAHQIGASILLIISSFFGLQTKQDTPTTTITPTEKIQVVQNKATSTPKIAKKTQIKKITTTKTPTNVVTKATPQTIVKAVPVQTDPQIPTEVLNDFVRKSVVNILCNTGSNGLLSPVSGSGVIVSDDGVILTNAHLAQYFLLKDFNGQKDYVSCLIRTGNPAVVTYTAELLYISPTWVSNNKTILLDQSPKGTGEHDYAFLRITGTTSGTPTGTLPHIDVNISENNAIGTGVILASYPAGFLGGQSIIQNLFQSSAITSIKNVFTFSTTTIDLISLGGSVVAQKGSSGGAVVNGKGQLIGIIATESEAKSTSDRDLRAITTAYINRDLKDESGQSIDNILSSPSAYAKNFNAVIAPKLTGILTNAILKK